MRRFFIALLVLGGVTACSASPLPVSAPAATPAEPSPTRTYAMTGLDAPSDWRPQPVLAVKVDNTIEGRPQQGIGMADMVIEEPVEGGLTRLAAFFESKLPDSVGPVRSVRISDVGLVAPVEATVVASGGAPDSLAAYQAAGITVVDESSSAMMRDPNRLAPYNLFADLTQIDRGGVGQDPKKPYFQFGSTKLAPGATVKQVQITFSPSRSESWAWRSAGFWEQRDLPFRPTTILILTVRTQDTGERDAAGSPIPEVITSGSGAGFLLIDGQARPILWGKRSPTSPFQFTTEAGLVIAIPPGKTWLALTEKGQGQVDFS